MTGAGFVYAIRAGDAVKIGWSADPLRRLNKIASDCATPCELAGCIEGSRADEAQLHARFAEHRMHREWFRLDGPVRAFVATMPKFASPIEIIDSPIKFIRKRVFAMSQLEFACAVGIANDQLSKIEGGRRRLSFGDMSKIRAAAKRDGLRWSDTWFFEIPAEVPAA